MQMPGRVANSKDYRYGFNGMEKDDELKGSGNSYDFGARIQDPRLGRFLSLDPLAKNYPSESNYTFAGDNPVYLIDVDGKYQYPADKEAGYRKAFPMLTKYLETMVRDDIMKSSNILNAMSESTAGNLTREKVYDMATWGSGPEIVFEDNPGFPQTGAYGYYDAHLDRIELNLDVAKKLETLLNSDASDEEKMKLFFAFYKTLTHETTHAGNYKRGDDLEKIVKTGEVGDQFERKVWGGDTYDPDFDDMYDPAKATEVIEEQKETEEGSKTLPTLPKNDDE